MTIRFFACAGLVATLVSTLDPTAAQADAMDLALERLVQRGDEACQQTLADPPTLRDPDSGEQILRVDNDAWAAVMAELGAATMPGLLQPVTTSGTTGIDVLFVQTLAGISSNAGYWERGSRGEGRDAQRDCSGRNRHVQNVLTRSQLRLIKSLPWGITFGSTLGKVWNTSLWTVGGELKLALVEGYRRLPVPDIAVRAAANTVVGDSQYTLTNLATSAIVSKPLVVARVARLTPYVAYQTGVSFASSSLVDLTPHTDSFARCDAPPGEVTGNLQCSGPSDDLGHDQPFANLTLLRHQLALGLWFRYRLLTIAADLSFDLVPVSRSDSQVPSPVGRQWSLGISPGVSF